MEVSVHSDKLNSFHLRTYLILLLIALSMGSPYSIYGQEDHPHEPPRPQLTPPTSVPDDPGDTKRNEGALIKLLIFPFVPGLWTGVQWIDGTGNWHDVGGWQGTFNQPDYISWFVEKKDFAKGPFRWVVYQRQGGELLAMSQPFYLPANLNEVIRSEVIIPDLNFNYQDRTPPVTMPEQPYRPVPRYWPEYNQYSQPNWPTDRQQASPCSDCHYQ